MEDIYQDFWEAFLEETGAPENSYCSRYTYFGENQEESVSVLEQLLGGEKTGISHCIPYYIVTRSPMPKAGDYTMVTDFYGNPCCILETAGVVIEPLPELPAEVAAMECQGAYEVWLARKHREFEALSKQGGFHYSKELPILMEQVRVVYPVKG